MLRGMKWLIGALAIAGGMLMALNGICSRPADYSGIAGFFCPRPKAPASMVPAPQVPVSPKK